MSGPRGSRRQLRGVVVRDKAAKTITVQVSRRFRHPKYGKMVSVNRRFHVHDEADAAHVGDTVEIVECRPMSRTKRWRLERIIERNPDQAIAASAEAPTPGPAPAAPTAPEPALPAPGQ